MLVDFYGLTIDTPQVTVSLSMPWRATHIEHRLFDAVRNLPGVRMEKDPDEWRVQVTDARTWKGAMQAISRVLKGWQEDAEPGEARRLWRWLLEGDTDPEGYDHNRERFTLWCFLQLGLQAGNPGESDRIENIDLDGFSVRIWPA